MSRSSSCQTSMSSSRLPLFVFRKFVHPIVKWAIDTVSHLNAHCFLATSPPPLSASLQMPECAKDAMPLNASPVEMAAGALFGHCDNEYITQTPSANSGTPPSPISGSTSAAPPPAELRIPSAAHLTPSADAVTHGAHFPNRYAGILVVSMECNPWSVCTCIRIVRA